MSVSAVLEALASELGTTESITDTLDDVIDNARGIDAQRRRRRTKT